MLKSIVEIPANAAPYIPARTVVDVAAVPKRGRAAIVIIPTVSKAKAVGVGNELLRSTRYKVINPKLEGPNPLVAVAERIHCICAHWRTRTATVFCRGDGHDIDGDTAPTAATRRAGN